MPNTTKKIRMTVALAACMSMIGLRAQAQGAPAAKATRSATPSSSLSVQPSFADLNLLGADAVMPLISDSIIPPDSAFRQTLLWLRA